MNTVKNPQGLDREVIALCIQQTLGIGDARIVIGLITPDKCKGGQAWVKFGYICGPPHHDRFFRIYSIEERDDPASKGICINIVKWIHASI